MKSFFTSIGCIFTALSGIAALTAHNNTNIFVFGSWAIVSAVLIVGAMMCFGFAFIAAIQEDAQIRRTYEKVEAKEALYKSERANSR